MTKQNNNKNTQNKTKQQIYKNQPNSKDTKQKNKKTTTLRRLIENRTL